MRRVLREALGALVLLAFSTGLATAQLLSFRDVLARDAPKPALTSAYGQGPQQFGELWLPPTTPNAKGRRHPVVILVHGGCWQAALPGVELMWPMADALAREGYAVWNIEYRRIGQAGGGYPGTFLDVANGVDHLRKLAEPHALDLKRVIAVGHSAGGHLALWAAARPKLPTTSSLVQPAPLAIGGVLGLAAIPDLASFSRWGVACGAGETVDQLIDARGRGKPAAYADTSISELAPSVPQVLLHGAFDPIVPPFAGQQYRDKVKLPGIEVKVIPDAGHFELIAPWTKAWREVLVGLHGLQQP